jgi:penicillin amidase
MKFTFFCFSVLWTLMVPETVNAQQKTSLKIPGIKESVEIIRDRSGVNHIYAKNEHDLFFAQGYCAARDRLFQFELWRRQATGTLSEILGERELKRDIGTRLFKFRGDLKKEFNHYHPRGEEIILAFTEGVNTYILEANKKPDTLPLEFKLLNIKPGLWHPSIVISRHQGLLSNLEEELAIARAVSVSGHDKIKQLLVFEPGDPLLKPDSSLDLQRLFDPVTELYQAFRKPLTFSPKDLVTRINTDIRNYERLAEVDEEAYQHIMTEERSVIGSNNWIVSGKKSQSGFPMLANDPHRAIAAPSLRYIVHLNAPGWNVVGGGEPTIPGVSIGHNDHGAWGLTVFSIDHEDLYVYQLNPENPLQYKYQKGWENMRIIPDTIRVKGAPDVIVQHKYTRHGPITYSDVKNNLAYAVRCGWMENGGAPYLASLRMDQSRNWEEFREACTYSRLPGENMIWADREGNIGWQVAGIAPVRKNWSGLIPVPGDGRYEWDGFLPVKNLPNVYNPGKGFWVTANENLVSKNYAFRNAVGWNWADSSRANRISEVLTSRQKHSFEDMLNLQCDYTSLPAQSFIPLLRQLTSQDDQAERARLKLLEWNCVLNATSSEAALYVTWERKLISNSKLLFIPQEVKTLNVPFSRVRQWILKPENSFGSRLTRDAFLIQCLEEAIEELNTRFGHKNMDQWKYGDEKFHHVLIKHPLSNAVDAETRKKLEAGPSPRGGNGSTPGMTGNTDNQTHGATFRMVADTQDWDKTMFTNAPGQSGDPASAFYKNLFEDWATDKHFPVYFTKTKIERAASEISVLVPLSK